MNFMRPMLMKCVVIQNPVDKNDLIDQTKTQDHLIQLLYRAASPSPTGLGYNKLILTCINSSHPSDAALGPHGHSHGFSVDCWPAKDAQLKQFVSDMIHNNRWVTKVGLGGAAAQALYPQAANGAVTIGGTVVFYDNDSPHIHLQTQ